MRRAIAALAGMLMMGSGTSIPSPHAGAHRVTADSKRGRKMISRTVRSRSNRMPHIGAKEQERAKRCYMRYSNPHAPTPTLCQMSKREYEIHFEELCEARYG
jgi:hypothetical protein